jgi:DMSO/TMAO reductase YedYZ molybdopterin-dependent catalytic subunit
MSKTDLGQRPPSPDDQPGDRAANAAARAGASASKTSAASRPKDAAGHQPPRWWGVVVGLLAAGVGLSVGELVAGFSRSLQSPVVAVGERVRDNAPNWLIRFAIDTFGAGTDKTAAILTIIAVIGIVAALVGIRTVRGHTRLGMGFCLGMGVLGAIASLRSAGAGFGSIFPPLLAAGAAALMLLYGTYLSKPRVLPAASRPRGAKPVAVVDRRRFLMHSGILGGAGLIVLAIGRNLRSRFDPTRERAEVELSGAKAPLPPPPSDPAADPVNKGLSTLITPNKNFYRIDTAFDVPRIDVDNWSMQIGGMVDNPISLTFAELSARELFEADITMSCVSNEVGGNLIGNARWLGCRLDALLKEAGVQPGADQVLGTSVDGFTAGFPVDVLDGRDAMIAIAMNGEPLPVEHGFPARIVVPGLYGYVSAVKWLREITLTTFEADEGYWIPRGWSALGPVKTESRIDVPRGDLTITPNNVIAGVAWAPHRGISKVEVQVDEQEWQEATLGPVLSQDTWVQWWLPWTPAAGRHRIRVRATDGTGETQTEQRANPDPDGATGWHTIHINAHT